METKKYKQQYNKEHYKTFKVDLRIEEMEQLEEYLKKIHLTKAQFLRYCIIYMTSTFKPKEKNINLNSFYERCFQKQDQDRP